MKNHRRTAFLSTILSVVFLLLASFRSTADELRYQFVQSGSNNVLAVMELAVLPADPIDVLSLEFTDAGASIFGFDGVYGGDFDSVFIDGQVIDDGMGGLRASFDASLNFVQFIDENPPANPLELNTFVMSFSNAVQLDELYGISDEKDIIIAGDWTTVGIPEPATTFPLAVFALFKIFVGRKIRR